MSLRAANSLLTNTTAIRGGSEQNSKQPNVHGCTFGCDGILGGSESAHPCIGFVSSFFHKLDNLKEDRLLEKGKHAELLEKTGYYTKLWNAQIEA